MVRFSKFIVSLVIFSNFIFTGVIVWVFCQTGQEPSVLVGAFFAFTTGELWALASIKKKKEEKHEYTEDCSSVPISFEGTD